MNMLFKNIAISTALVSGLQAMEAENTSVENKEIAESKQSQIRPRKELTFTESLMAHDVWLLKQAVAERKLPSLSEDIRYVIGGKLHEFYNPLLYSEFVYTNKPEKAIFKIKDFINEDGSIDLSNTAIFGNIADSLLITFYPETFFRFDENSTKLVILLAPKSVIEEKIKTSALPFKSIMENWDAAQAPIGVFYRMENWRDLTWFDYHTRRKDLMSNHDLFSYWVNVDRVKSDDRFNAQAYIDTELAAISKKIIFPIMELSMDISMKMNKQPQSLCNIL